jgi:hypothetical protein
MPPFRLGSGYSDTPAGIHLHLYCMAEENLDSGRRRNDERKSRIPVDGFSPLSL